MSTQQRLVVRRSIAYLPYVVIDIRLLGNGSPAGKPVPGELLLLLKTDDHVTVNVSYNRPPPPPSVKRVSPVLQRDAGPLFMINDVRRKDYFLFPSCD